jgi:hypothetical protein
LRASDMPRVREKSAEGISTTGQAVPHPRPLYVLTGREEYEETAKRLERGTVPVPIPCVVR